MDRIKAGVSSSVDLTGMSEWLEKNTAHPKRPGRQWSFEGHEMQKGIANDPRHHVVVRKCSQVGLSELSVRICLALLSIYPGHTAIYTLPTAAYARKFTKARFDPVITASDYLKGQVPSNNDSSELKQIGTSFLYIVGTSGQSAPISIPADILVRDEVDFSNQSILSTFYSRLGHAEGGGIIRDFSTPTVGGYGISEDFEESTQSRYMIRHDVCNQMVDPTFLDDVVIPGFSGKMQDLDRSDLDNNQYKFDDAYLRCPHCRKPITPGNLADPDKRAWVEAFPTASVGGFQIMPFDVPSINPIAKTVRAVKNYEKKSDWINFEMGVPFEDAENSFVRAVVEQNSILLPVPPRPLAAYDTVAGLDIGKTAHLTIGKRVGKEMHILHREAIRATTDTAIVSTVKERMEQFGIIKMVVDAGPDFSTAMTLIADSLVDQVYGCYYVRSNSTAFSNYDVKDEEQIVNANKVRCFDHTAKQVNKGFTKFPHGTHKDTYMEHLSCIKRVKRQNSDGETVAAWVSTGAEHYAHSLNYLYIADQLCDYVSDHAVTPVLPGATRVKVGGMHDAPQPAKLMR